MTPRTRRIRNIVWMCAVCTGIMLALFAIPPEQFPRASQLAHAELVVRDWLHNQSSASPRFRPDPRLIFIGIDQTSYADVIAPEEAAASPALAALTNNFPWSRDLWAEAIERLAGAGAKAVVLDLIFASPGKGDDRLRAALDKYPDQVVIGANFIGGMKAGGNGISIIYPTESVLAVQDAMAAWKDRRLGFINVFSGADAGPRDVDDVVRRAIYRVTGERGLPPGVTLESVASRALSRLGASGLTPQDDHAHLFRYVAGPGDGFRPISLPTIFLPDHWTNNFDAGKFFDGKIVIIGPAANILQDKHATPFNATMLGPEIHLNIMNAVLNRQFLGETPPAANYALIFGLGGLAFLLSLVVQSPVRRLFVAAVVAAAYGGLCFLTLHYADYFLLAVAPMLAFGSGTFTGFTYDFFLVRAEKNRTRRTLERYVSKDVVRELLDNPATYLNTIGGVRKPVTVLFSDVRGFTTMTEGADAAQLVLQLNEYFTEMVAIVFREHGTLDKFIGDAVMAHWGSITTEGVERDAQHAVATALEMRRALARLNINWEQRGMKALAFGIGLNHGEVIVGNLGSDEKRELSVIGDAINLGSRLEGLTKEYKLDLLIGETMVPLVQSRFVLRTVGSVQVKGKTVPIRIFTVMADKQAGEQPPAWLARYEEGLLLYRDRKFTEAEAVFVECLRAQPDDYISKMYRDECRELLAHPPGLDWNTVVVMKSK